MKPIIRVEGLSKQYRLGANQAYATFRESLMNGLRAPLKRLRRDRDTGGETLWALDGISFEVAPGEVVGVIGRNGAGKSTLLKILSRITEPTGGRVELFGRVGSLLEVGTGFHPELTGRENIYLNGAILGMRKAEIVRKFDEIVAFAEVDRFIDTPVKRYSSGMYVRLAFAVAAYLEPDILIVDEVLAVGDMEFQKKCLGKMQDVTRHGRTVLFVSHNMAAIKSLCSRVILLKAGRIVSDGDVNRVVDDYFTVGAGTVGTGIISKDAPRIGTGEARFHSVRLVNRHDENVTDIYFGQELRLILSFEAHRDLPDAIIEIGIATMDGLRAVTWFSTDGGNPPTHFRQGHYTISVDFDIVLLPRRYCFEIAIHHLDGTTMDDVERTLDFTILNVSEEGDDYYRWSSVRGFVRPTARWRVLKSNEARLTSSIMTEM